MGDENDVEIYVDLMSLTECLFVSTLVSKYSQELLLTTRKI